MMHQFLSDVEAAAVQAAGIPVDSFNPRRFWIACLDRESVMPTPHELLQVRSAIEFLVTHGFVGEKPERILAEQPLPADAGFNTIVFKKIAQDGVAGWQFRRASWNMGPTYVPPRWEPGYKPYSFTDVMDRASKLRPEPWATWKADHADLFPAQEVS